MTDERPTQPDLISAQHYEPMNVSVTDDFDEAEWMVSDWHERVHFHIRQGVNVAAAEETMRMASALSRMDADWYIGFVRSTQDTVTEQDICYATEFDPLKIQIEIPIELFEEHAVDEVFRGLAEHLVDSLRNLSDNIYDGPYPDEEAVTNYASGVVSA